MTINAKIRQSALSICILWMAVWLRFHRLAAQSFWNDEGNSARLSERSIRLIIEGTASDIHPPLYYLSLRVWRELLGANEFGLRSFSAFCGVLIVVLTIKLGDELFPSNRRIGQIGALLVAISPAHVYYSQETRMYTLLPLLALAATWVFLRWRKEPSRTLGVVYALLLTAGFYTHYFFPIIVAVHGAALLLDLKGFKNLSGLLVRWLAWVGLAVIFYLPWLPFMLNGLGGNRGVGQSVGDYVLGFGRFLIGGSTSTMGWDGTLPLVLLGVGLILLLIGLIRPHPQKMLLLLAGLPPLALLILGATDAAFYKFLLLSIPAFALGLAGLWGDKLALRWLALPLLGFLAWGNFNGLDNFYRNPDFAKADYRGMAARIAADDHSNAGIILNAPNQWEVFTYYHTEGAPTYPLPLTQNEGQVLSELEEIGRKHDRLYTLYWGEQQQDPQGWVENWLTTNTFKASEEWVGDVRFAIYAVPHQAATTIQTQTDAAFGDQLLLAGYTVLTGDAQAGDALQVTLFWQATANLDQRYKFFVHLLNDDGALVAQQDWEPRQFTSDWPVGQLQRENVALLLPPDLPNGDYQTIVGVYDIANPTNRLPLPSGETTLPFFNFSTQP